MRILLALLIWVPWAADSAVTGRDQGQRITKGLTTRIASLNPYTINGIDSFTMTGLVIETLARINPYTQDLEPALALDWTVLEKEKRIRVHLRKGVKFHNGQEFTSEDVRFTWSSYFKPEYKGEMWRGMWDRVESVEVPEPYVVEFKMKELGYQQFKNIISSLRILPHEYYGKVNHEEWRDKLIGTGPFHVAGFESNGPLELAPSKNWWGWAEYRVPVAPPVLFKSVPDSRLAEFLVEKSELDLFEVPSGESYQGSLSPRLARTPFGRGLGFGLNLKNPLLKDVRLRKALLLLWNRIALNEKIFLGRYRLALDSFSPSMYYYPKRKPTAYDPKAARKLLAQMGFEDRDQDSFLDKDGERLRLKAIVRGHATDRWVDLYQADAAKLGIEIRVERIADESQWWHQIKQGKYDLAAFDGAFSEAPHASVLHSKGPYNTSGFNHAKADRLFDQLEKEFNSQKRRRLYRQLIVLIRDEVIELPGLYTNYIYYLASPDVTFDENFPQASWRWRKRNGQNPRNEFDSLLNF